MSADRSSSRVWWGGVAVAGVAAVLMVGTAPVAVHASSKKDKEAGRALFEQKGCAHCHGTDGVGGERGPSLLGVGRKLKKDQIEHQIEAGGGGMPAFGDILQKDDVSELVAWLKTQRKWPAKTHSAAPQKSNGAASAGSDDQS